MDVTTEIDDIIDGRGPGGAFPVHPLRHSRKAGSRLHQLSLPEKGQAVGLNSHVDLEMLRFHDSRLSVYRSRLQIFRLMLLVPIAIIFLSPFFLFFFLSFFINITRIRETVERNISPDYFSLFFYRNTPEPYVGLTSQAAITLIAVMFAAALTLAFLLSSKKKGRLSALVKLISIILIFASALLVSFQGLVTRFLPVGLQGIILVEYHPPEQYQVRAYMMLLFFFYYVSVLLLVGWVFGRAAAKSAAYYLDKREASTLCVDSVLAILIALRRNDSITYPNERKRIQTLISHLAKETELIATQFNDSNAYFQSMLNSHFGLMAAYIRDRGYWAIAPIETTRSTLIKDFSFMARIYIDGSYGDFRWTEKDEDKIKIINETGKDKSFIRRTSKFVVAIVIPLGILLLLAILADANGKVFGGIDSITIWWVAVVWFLLGIDSQFELGLTAGFADLAKGIKEFR